MEYFSENISVAVRIRPLFSYDNPSKIAWDPASYSCLRSVCDEKKFEFDKVYGMNSSTQRIFDEMCEQPIWKAMDGLNCSIVCYGQTGSGKTYTMCGKKKSPGIIPLTIQAIFSYIEDTPSKEFLMRCSYCEIYNECINDLLNPLNVNLPIMDDKNVIGMQRGPIILGLTEEVCKTSDQIFAILKVGDAHKKVPSTNFNQKSNRSHCV
jgi:centromeric protein E